MSEPAFEQAEPVNTEPDTTPSADSAPPAERPSPPPAAALSVSLPPRPAAQRARRAPGLTGRGICTIGAVTTLVGGLADMAISGHRGHLFGVLFVIASAVGALAVRKKDLPTAMVAPPLIYCVLIFVMSLIDRDDQTGGPLTREAFYLGNAFVTGAPAIWIGSLLAAGIGWSRLRSDTTRSGNATGRR